MDEEQEPPYEYSIADETDDEGNARHLHPGTYLFVKYSQPWVPAASSRPDYPAI